MSDTEDRRSRRSRRTLSEALMGLMHEHDWGDISVQMICDRADVARSTFYAHYQTKQDLLDMGFAHVAAELDALTVGTGLTGILEWLVRHLQGSVAFHRRLQGSPAGLAIMTRFRRSIRDRIAQKQGGISGGPSHADLDFAVGGMFGVLETWMADGCREDASRVVAGLVRRIRRIAELPEAH